MAQSQSQAERCTGCQELHDDYSVSTRSVESVLDIQKLRILECNRCGEVFRREGE